MVALPAIRHPTNWRVTFTSTMRTGAFVSVHRGDHNRLGVAVQLGSLRLLGTFLEDPTQTPASVTRFAGDQLAIDEPAELMV